jgi:hypothetical protein
MKDEILMPCTKWAEKLAARHPEDISPSGRTALNNHIASCKACAAVYTAYRMMEINVGALPTTSLPGLSYDRLRRDRSIMPPLFSLLVYFGLFSRGESQTATTRVHPTRRLTYIKLGLFYHASIACLVLILLAGVVGLSISARTMAPKFSAVISSPTAFAAPSALSNAPSSRIRPINLLFLNLHRLCPDYFSPSSPQKVDSTQQQRQSGNLACRVLQTGG